MIDFVQIQCWRVVN